jgi:antitoxin (DNA-binding transcriptional repressor) of toxin-antitoxin stability system
MEVGIRRFRLHLSAYLERVRGGETIIVTDRGAPIARVEKVTPDAPPAAVQRLVQSGRLTYKPRSGTLPTPVDLPAGAKTSTDYLAEQRR